MSLAKENRKSSLVKFSKERNSVELKFDKVKRSPRRALTPTEAGVELIPIESTSAIHSTQFNHQGPGRKKGRRRRARVPVPERRRVIPRSRSARGTDPATGSEPSEATRRNSASRRTSSTSQQRGPARRREKRRTSSGRQTGAERRRAAACNRKSKQ